MRKKLTMIEAASEKRKRTFYGRRKGKPLTAQQSERYERLKPEVSFCLSNPQKNHRPQAPLWLEIGFGGGEHLLHQAGEHRDVDFIGAEPFINGVSKLIRGIEVNNLTNVRLHEGDALDVLDALVPESLDRVFLLYPDPWPKRRHNQRRFISQKSVAALARTMKTGAQLDIATDIDDYAAWILNHLHLSKKFIWTAKSAQDWLNPWQGWHSTRYESKALREGRTPSYLRFEKI